MMIRRTERGTEHSVPKSMAEHTVLRFCLGLPYRGVADVPDIYLVDVSFIDDCIEAAVYTKDLTVGLFTLKLKVVRDNL